MLTFGELKKITDIPEPGRKTPTAKELRKAAEPAAEKALRGGAAITAYRSGYAVYSVCRAATVFRIHACGGYCYDHDSGDNPCGIEGTLFDDEAWYLRLVLEGEDRLGRNCGAKGQGQHVSYSSVSEEWGEMASGEEGALERIIRKETVESLLSVLTGKQKLAVRRFYLEQKTKKQIAGELGITAAAVTRILARSVDRMRRSAACGGNTQPGGIS